MPGSNIAPVGSSAGEAATASRASGEAATASRVPGEAATASRASGEAATASRGQYGKVLVVDDDPDFVEYTRIVLESHGYEVRTASTADLALRLMRQEKPDVALLDVMMSYVLDGIQLTRQMCDDPDLCHIPVIMISAIVSKEEAGAFPTDECVLVKAFMTKPVDPGELLRQVAELIGRPPAAESPKEG